MSSEIYELMKRSDEAAVVEKAHRRPRFVEDCVREMIGGVLADVPRARRRRVRLRAAGEPRVDPPARRHGRALRAARRAAPRARHRRALRRITSRCASGSTAPPAAGASTAAQPVEVLGAGQHGHRDRDVDEDVDPGRRPVDPDQRQHHRHLRRGLELAPHARGDDLALLDRQHAQAGDRELARDDHHRHPGVEPVERDEADERGGDQQLVGERVHQLAELRDLRAAAGEPAVERVGGGGDHEHDRGEQVRLRQRGEQQGREHRDERDANEREDVRRVELHDQEVRRQPRTRRRSVRALPRRGMTRTGMRAWRRRRT